MQSNSASKHRKTCGATVLKAESRREPGTNECKKDAIKKREARRHAWKRGCEEVEKAKQAGAMQLLGVGFMTGRPAAECGPGR